MLKDIAVRTHVLFSLFTQLKIFLEFYTKPIFAPSRNTVFVRKIWEAFHVVKSYENRSRRDAKLKDEIQTNYETRCEIGLHIPQLYFDKAKAYAEKKCKAIFNEGLRYVKEVPQKKLLQLFLQRLVGILEYGIAAFSNGQVIIIIYVN